MRSLATISDADIESRRWRPTLNGVSFLKPTIPQTPIACWQTRGACAEAASLRLLTCSAKASVERSSRSASAAVHSSIALRTSARRSDSCVMTCESLMAAGTGSAGGRRGAGGGADEGAGAVECVGGDAEPEVRPQQVADRDHRLGGDGRERRAHHLL